MAQAEQQHPNLNLSPEERRLFGALFAQADSGKIGVVTGEDAVKFFEKTRLSADTLGEIWQIADEENRGLLTPPGFGMVLRLIGYAQAGRPVSMELALKPGGPLPRFDGINLNSGLPVPARAHNQSSVPAPLQAQISGGPIRVPPLASDKIIQYTKLFEESAPMNGFLSGDTAKSIFERAQLPNETLGAIWGLADTSQRGSLDLTEFIIAMHLLASTKSGSLRALPQILPPGLYEAASRRGNSRTPGAGSGKLPGDGISPSATRNFTSQSQLPQSPQFAPPQRQFSAPPQLQPAATGESWAISSSEKEQFDKVFAGIDTENKGYMTGEQAISFFSNARLEEDVLAQIWDLADINSEGQLNKEEFAVAMYLIRQQRAKTVDRNILPTTLPANLVPPSMRRQQIAPQQPTAPNFDNAANITTQKSAADDLFGLDAAYPTASNDQNPEADRSVFSKQQTSQFKPFKPTSSFGQTMISPQSTGTASLTSSAAPPKIPSGPVVAQHAASDDLLGDNDPKISGRLTAESADLGNLHNQIDSIRSTMQDNRAEINSGRSEIASQVNLKQELETQLSHLRSVYDNEVRQVRAMQVQLRESQESTGKLRADLALLQGTHADLQNQSRNLSESLAADKAENENVKTSIRQMTAEIDQMKPQLEKLQSETRHQKGLVAINKKQLATIELEREKRQRDISAATNQRAEAIAEREHSEKAVNSGRAEASVPLPSSTESARAPGSSSPFPASMNPFHRTNSNKSKIPEGTPFSSQGPASDGQSAFDSLFSASDPSFGNAPATSFTSDGHVSQQHFDERGTNSPIPREQAFHTPSMSDGNPHPTDTPNRSMDVAPPPPPQSRQMTSSVLPLRPQLLKNHSQTSSVNVLPSASRAGDPISDSPSRELSRSMAPKSPKQHFQEIAEAQQHTEPPKMMETSDHDIDRSPPSRPEVPGAFPGDEIDDAGSTKTKSRGEVASSDKMITTPDFKDDFDKAFEGMSTGQTTLDDNQDPFAPETTNANTGPFAANPLGHSTKAKHEFPPLQEFEDDDDEDESEDEGMAPAMTSSDLPTGNVPENTSDSINAQGSDNFSRAINAGHESIKSELPTPNAQSSPPPYPSKDAFSETPGAATAFPAEFSGLLPSRENPVQANPYDDSGSSNSAHQAPDITTAAWSQSNSNMTRTNTADPPAHYEERNVPEAHAGEVPARTQMDQADGFDDFEDLTPAQEADAFDSNTLDATSQLTPFPDFTAEKTGDRKDAFDTSFDHSFDQPMQQTPLHLKGESLNFAPPRQDQQPFNPSASTNTVQYTPQPPSNNDNAPSEKHDWDAIFAGLDTSPVKADVGPFDNLSPNKDDMTSSPFTSNNIHSAATTATPPPPPPPRPSGTAAPVKNSKSATSSDDDPILQRLMGMGFARTASLQALEKYDYNIDKAAESLVKG